MPMQTCLTLRNCFLYSNKNLLQEVNLNAGNDDFYHKFTQKLIITSLVAIYFSEIVRYRIVKFGTDTGEYGF